jgi:hypothetical protein
MQRAEIRKKFGSGVLTDSSIHRNSSCALKVRRNAEYNLRANVEKRGSQDLEWALG